jgi:hypothetical protein
MEVGARFRGGRRRLGLSSIALGSALFGLALAFALRRTTLADWRWAVVVFYLGVVPFIDCPPVLCYVEGSKKQGVYGL